MSFRLGITICFLLLVGTTAKAVPCTQVNARPDAWVTERVDALILSARRAFEDDKGLPGYDRVLSGIASTIHQCKLDQDVVFASRYPQFLEYIATLSLGNRSDHELGFEVPDRQYFAETSQYVQVPEFLLDQGFLRAVSRHETLNRAKAFLRQLNSTRKPAEQLIFFSYESRHLGTPDNDNSFRRLLIVVPGNAEQGVPDKWVQFGVTDRGARPRVRNVSVVTAVPGPDDTSNVYFKDFFRTYRRDGSITLTGRWELGFGDDKCVQCHKSGILPIFPENGSVSADEQAALLEVNERFLTYGSPRFDKYLDARKYGPGLSSASDEDRKRRFGAGFEKTVAGRAMTCSTCHQHNRLGSLNWPMDQTLISSFVKGGQMPYGYRLQPAERNEVFDKLIQEYFSVSPTNPGILKSWLLGQRQQ
jgi:hypothetical protein